MPFFKHEDIRELHQNLIFEQLQQNMLENKEIEKMWKDGWDEICKEAQKEALNKPK